MAVIDRTTKKVEYIVDLMTMYHNEIRLDNIKPTLSNARDLNDKYLEYISNNIHTQEDEEREQTRIIQKEKERREREERERRERIEKEEREKENKKRKNAINTICIFQQNKTRKKYIANSTTYKIVNFFVLDRSGKEKRNKAGETKTFKDFLEDEIKLLTTGLPKVRCYIVNKESTTAHKINLVFSDDGKYIKSFEIQDPLNINTFHEIKLASPIPINDFFHERQNPTLYAQLKKLDTCKGILSCFSGNEEYISIDDLNLQVNEKFEANNEPISFKLIDFNKDKQEREYKLYEKDTGKPITIDNFFTVKNVVCKSNDNTIQYDLQCNDGTNKDPFTQLKQTIYKYKEKNEELDLYAKLIYASYEGFNGYDNSSIHLDNYRKILENMMDIEEITDKQIDDVSKCRKFLNEHYDTFKSKSIYQFLEHFSIASGYQLTTDNVSLLVNFFIRNKKGVELKDPEQKETPLMIKHFQKTFNI